MPDYGYPGFSPYAEALERLQRARTLQLWSRMALWVWCAAIIAWALPAGPWSTANLAPWAALASGFFLTATGTGLGRLHRRVSCTDAIRASIAQARAESSQI